MPAVIPQIGGIVRSARRGLGLTRPELVKKSSVSKRTIAAVENNESKPSFEALCCLVDALDISADQVVCPHRALRSLEDDQFINGYLACDEHQKEALRGYLRALRQDVSEKQG
jgi:transcriptional regulator with XRE-family HTH domain